MDAEIVWAAGLFEGEGCLAFHGNRPQLTIKMIHEQSVRRFHAAMGVGAVYGPYGPYEHQLGKKPYFTWVAYRRSEVERGIELLRPYLTDWAVARLDRAPGERIADVATAPVKPRRRRPPEGADPDAWLFPSRSRPSDDIT